MRNLTTYVHVDGVQYGPRKPPPPEVARRITNPDVWDGPAEIEQATTSTQSLAQPPAPPAPQTESQGDHESVDTLPEPPRSGRGSGLDAWLAYAKQEGVVVPEDSERNDVIALVDAHKAG